MREDYLDTTTFSCDVETIYPIYEEGQKIFCTIVRQKLTVDKVKYVKGDIIKGFVSMDFVETAESLKHKKQKTNFFFKGFFKTKIE